MVQVVIGDNPETRFELHIEGKMVVRSGDRALIDWLSENEAFLERCHQKFDSHRERPETSKAIKVDLWKDLPAAAKNILEWIESPDTGAKNRITIEIGKRPSFSVSRAVPREGNQPIVVDDGLYKTIRYYVLNSKEDSDYPYKFEEANGRLSIWNDMPEHSLSVRGFRNR